VIEASMDCAKAAETDLLLEATCNQVNHQGGYTGMTPEAFRKMVLATAQARQFPVERLILGGDHLGPSPWKHLPAGRAMPVAVDMVRAYVRAGFTKIHLDTSMACADDPAALSGEVIAERAAELCAAAEEVGNGQAVYVIGTEVPTPGGAMESLEHLSVTTRSRAEETLAVHRRAFRRHGLEAAWDRVIALVVQPGVEFSHDSVAVYAREQATELVKLLQEQQGLIFEAHSTDYQPSPAYRELVEDGFAILKVGPALTFAMRETLFRLSAIEAELVPTDKQAVLPEVLEQVMLANPDHWEGHYHGNAEELRLMRRYSYSDRVRYYWNDPAVKGAVTALIDNLRATGVPETLLSTWMPEQYQAVRRGKLGNDPVELVRHSIGVALRPYVSACS
jgi:D-tagatose-1,6-bisphosphate aldolase subunit GatZ/KbaZ